MTTKIPLKIASKVLICQKAESLELFMLHVYITKTVLYRRKYLNRIFRATGYPGRRDSTKKTFFLGHLFYMYIYVQS